MNDQRQTTAVILAAGRGCRLGLHTAERPKCLVQVGNQTILSRMLAAAVHCRISRIVVVTGYRAKAIEHALADCRNVDVEFVHNRRYMETGTSASLYLGLRKAGPTGDIVIIEGDVLFDPHILQSVLSQDAEAATALSQWQPGLSGSLAVVKDGRVTAWLHENRRPKDFLVQQHYKTVNITWLSTAAWKRGLLPALIVTLKEDGKQAPVEHAFHRLVKNPQYRIQAVPVGDCKWFEVDTPEDLSVATMLFAN